MRAMKTPAVLLTVALLSSSALGAPADDARAAAAQGDTVAAIAAWERAIEAEPDVPEHYEALGRAHLRARDYEAAARTYGRLVEAVPAHARGRYRLAFALRKAGRFDEAAAAYRAYIDAAPSDPDGHFGLARTLEKLSRLDEARAAYERYVELERRPSEVKWVEQAKARIATLTPAAPPPTISTAPPAEVPSAGPQPRTEIPAGEGALPGAATAASTPVPAVSRSASPPSAGGEELLADSPVAQASPAADPDAAFASGRYAAAAAGYLVRLERGDDPADRYRAAVAATLAGDRVVAARQLRLLLGAAPTHAAGQRLARATAAELARRRESIVRTSTVGAALRDNRLRTAARLAARGIEVTEDPAARAALSWARGRALARLGRHDEALVELKRAASIQPADADLWAELSDVAARRGDRAAATGFREIAAAIAPAGHPLARSTPQPPEGR